MSKRYILHLNSLNMNLSYSDKTMAEGTALQLGVLYDQNYRVSVVEYEPSDRVYKVLGIILLVTWTVLITTLGYVAYSFLLE